MPEQSDTLKVLTRVPSEVEASLVVLRLADYGIAATAVGGFSAEDRAEAPGSVEVMVKSTDLLAAEAALAFIQGERFSEPAADDDEDDYEDEDEVDAASGVRMHGTGRRADRLANNMDSVSAHERRHRCCYVILGCDSGDCQRRPAGLFSIEIRAAAVGG